MPSGNTLGSGPGLGDDITLVTDAYIGGAKLWRVPDLGVRADPSPRAVFRWAVARQVAVASTFELPSTGHEDEPTQLHLEVWDLARGARIKDLAAGSTSAQQDARPTSR